MPTTASQILTRSFTDIGVIQPGEALGADVASSALSSLNNMLSGWRTQYGTVTAVERTLFPLVSDKQTYTIGLGGDFNVPKPNTIQGAGLLMQGLDAAVSVTSITRSGYTATVTQTAHGLSVGDEVLLAGATQIAYNGLQTVQTVPTANTYTFTIEGLPTSPAVGTLTAQAISGQPVEIPRSVITNSAYQAIGIKNLPNGLFTNVYYNPTGPFGTIFLWPKPNTAINQLVLYLSNIFSGFADLTTEYDYPDTPGYAEAIQYQFDLRLMIAYPSTGGRDDIERMAKQTFGLIKRANNKLNDVGTDATVLAWNPRYGYNINSDTGG